jgi:DNA-binding NtrC family response regulator
MNTNNNLLFVDDEMNMLSMIKRNFINSNYKIFLASNAKKALEIIKENEIKVIITDLQMPEMNGIELIERIEKQNSNMIKMVLTGNNQVPNILATINNGNIFRYIVKPINFKEELFPVLEEACKLYDINKLKEKLLIDKEMGILEENKLPTSLLNSLLSSSYNYLEITNQILKKAPYLNKEVLEKLSLDAVSRLEVIKDNLQTIEKIINKTNN